MTKHEKAVRDAAVALDRAIGEAEAAGFAIVWPRYRAALTSISISATAKVRTPASTRPATSKEKKS